MIHELVWNGISAEKCNNHEVIGKDKVWVKTLVQLDKNSKSLSRLQKATQGHLILFNPTCEHHTAAIFLIGDLFRSNCYSIVFSQNGHDVSCLCFLGFVRDGACLGMKPSCVYM